jgi:O-antigen ligase
MWAFRIVAVGIFLAEVVVLPGASSPFRLSKEAVILIAICLALGFAVAAAARRGSFVFPTSRLVLVLLALPVLQAVSALWSASSLRALESTALSAMWVLGMLWLSTLGTEQRRRLVLAASFGVVASASVMVVQLGGFSVFNFTNRFASKRLALTGLTGNPADLAMAAVLLLPLLLVGTNSKKWKSLDFALVIILVLAALLTRTLTGIAAVAAVLAIWLIQQKSRRLWVGAAALGAVLLMVALFAGLGDRVEKTSKSLQKGDFYALLSARADGWTAAEEMVRSRPVTGVGAANFTHLYYPSRVAWFSRNGGVGRRGELASHFEWAHCDPLQMVAELGIPGVVWMIALLAAITGVRKRAGPIVLLAAAAVTPFALLHYPTHLAVGLIPIILIGAEIIASSHDPKTFRWRTARVPISLLLIILAAMGSVWQLRRVAADLWVGGQDLRLRFAEGSAPEARVRQAAIVEAQILPRIERLPGSAPVLWRTVGRARILRNDFNGAESAFRSSYALWPHEDAEFYLGMSLVAQGRRSEGLAHLGRVCRTNPQLVQLIADEDLKRSVEGMLEAYRGDGQP